MCHRPQRARRKINRPFIYSLLLLIPQIVHAELSAERQTELMNLLEQDCGSCHGLTRKGGLGPSLLPDALSGKTDALLVQTVLDGRPGTPMPPWRPFLNEDEAQWLIDTLRAGEGL